MGLHIGIDFGTSTISASVWHPESDKVNVLPAILKDVGPVPNAIFYAQPTKKFLGVQAQKRSITNPQHYVSEIKRELCGEGWNRRIFEQEKNAVDIATDIFSIIKENIQRNFGDEEIESVVITVPFAFLYIERMKILQAAKRANLPVLQLIEEPVAAALAAGILDNPGIHNDSKILVFDFGGGTLDITVFSKQVNKNTGEIEIEVITTDGDASFGGKDIDQIIINRLIELMGIDLSLIGFDSQANKFKVKMSQRAEVIKKNFTEQNEVHEFFIDEWQKAHDIKLNYETFNNWIEGGLLYRLNHLLDDMLFEVDLQPNNIDHIILVGGSSYLRPVQQKLRRYFQKVPILSDDLTTLVAKGAGIYCGMLHKNQANISIKQKISHHVGVNVGGKMYPVLLRNTPYGTLSPKVPIPSRRLAIYQGNSVLLDECRKIGFLDLTDKISTIENYTLQIESNLQGMISVYIYKGEQLLYEQPMTIMPKE
jgi:molecular chaperone DnaK (HSP70)